MSRSNSMPFVQISSAPSNSFAFRCVLGITKGRIIVWGKLVTRDQAKCDDGSENYMTRAIDNIQLDVRRCSMLWARRKSAPEINRRSLARIRSQRRACLRDNVQGDRSCLERSSLFLVSNTQLCPARCIQTGTDCNASHGQLFRFNEVQKLDWHEQDAFRPPSS